MELWEIFFIWTIFSGSVIVIEGFSSHSSLCFEPSRGSGNTESSQVCNNSQSLQCKDDTVIMITSITFLKKTFNGNDGCSYCSNTSTATEVIWNISSKVFMNILYGSCSKQQYCFIDDLDFVPSQEIGSYNFVWLARVTYDCIAQALFEDICSSRETTLQNENDSVHLTLNYTVTSDSICSCIVDGDMDLVFVDYRPYQDNFTCSNSLVYINDEEKFSCVETGINDSSVYNTPVNVTDKRANITVSIETTSPQMLWLYIKGPNVTVNCNNGSYDFDLANVTAPTIYTSPSQTTFVTQTESKSSTEQHTTNFTTRLPTDETASPQSSETMSSVTDLNSTTMRSLETTVNSSKHFESATNDDFLNTSTIVWASVGLFAVIIVISLTICIVYRRKNRMYRTKSDQNMYNEVYYEADTTGKAECRIEVRNQTYEPGIEDRDSILTASEDNQDNVSNVYSEPADTIVDDAKPRTDGLMKYLPATKNKDASHNYLEPFDKISLTENNDRKSDYAVVIKRDENKDVYDTFAGKDNYSHINGFTSRHVPIFDNYSHIKIKNGNNNSKIASGSSIDTYSQFSLEDNNQSCSVDSEDKHGDKANNEEEEEYDHLANYSHH